MSYSQSEVHTLSAVALVGDPYRAPSEGPPHTWSSKVRRRIGGEVGALVSEAFSRNVGRSRRLDLVMI